MATKERILEDNQAFQGVTPWKETRAEIKAIDVSLTRAAILTELGRQSLWAWDATVAAATHQGDPTEQTYLAPNAAADGAWVKATASSSGSGGGVIALTEADLLALPGPFEAGDVGEVTSDPDPAKNGFWAYTTMWEFARAYPEVTAEQEANRAELEADRSEAAAAEIVAQANGQSLKFFDYNGHDLGNWGVLMQSTATNFPAMFGADGMFFTAFTLPQERLLSGRRFGLFGNRFVGGNNIGVRFGGYAHSTAGDRGLLEIQIKNAAYTPAIPNVPTDVVRVLFGVIQTGTNLQSHAIDIDTGTVYSSAVVDATGLTSISTFTGNQVLIGGLNNATTQPVPNAGISEWTGEIGWIGYSDAAGTLADLQAIAAGVDPITRLGAANLPWVRRLSKDAASLSAPPAATGDTTAAAVASDDSLLIAGSNILPTAPLTINKDKDGQVYGSTPGGSTAPIPVDGLFPVALTADDVVQARVIDSAHNDLTGWQDVAFVASGSTAWAGILTCPESNLWCGKEVRLRSDPGNTYFDNSQIGIGTVPLAIGQSEIQQILGDSTLELDYSGETALSYAETVTVSGIKGQRISRMLKGSYFSDGIVAAGEQFAKVSGGALMLVSDGVPNTSIADWIDDSQTNRLFSDTKDIVVYTKSQVNVIDFGLWFTAMRTGDAGVLHLDPGIKGIGPNVSDHWLYEDGFLSRNAQLVMTAGKNSNVAGNTAFDNDQVTGVARQFFRDWENANLDLVKVGPEGIYELLDQFHPSSTEEGKVRAGRDIGLRAAIGRGRFDFKESYVDSTSFQFEAGNGAFTFSVVNPNYRAIRNATGATYDNGADKHVGGVEISGDGGTTWNYLGLANAATIGDAQLNNRYEVRCTKPSGAWPAGLLVRVGKGGAFAYGLSNPDSMESQRKYWIYDGNPLVQNGRGCAMRTSEEEYTVAAA